MSAVIILGFAIIAGAVVGLAILQVAHEVIISRLYSGPMIDDEPMPSSVAPAEPCGVATVCGQLTIQV